MPAGGILTFNDVVQAGREGAQYRQRQQDMQQQRQRQEQEQAREDQQRARLEAANQEAAAVIERSKAEWARNGAQGEYRPNNSTMLQAAEARGLALARAGDWDGFMRNEVAVQPQRMRVRQGALQQFELDGDVDKLARAVYPTIFDGKQITGSELVKGGTGSLKGAPSGPDKWRFTMSDGSVQTVDPIKLVGDLKRMSDPETAKQEVMLNFERAKRDIQTKGQEQVERTRGEEDRKTLAQRGAQNLNEIEGRNEGAENRTQIRVDGQIRAAELRGRSGGGGGGGGGSANTKAWQQATRDVDNARKTLDNEVRRATTTKIKDNLRAMTMTPEQKDALVNSDAGVQRARADLLEAQRRAKRLADKAEGVSGGDATESKPAPAASSDADALRKLWGGGSKP